MMSVRKQLLFFPVSILFISLGFIGLKHGDFLPDGKTEARNADETKPNFKNTYSFIGVGDIMMGSNFPDSSVLPPKQGAYLFDAVHSHLKEADVAFGNIEGVLLDSGKVHKTCRDSSMLYLFRQPTHFGKLLSKSGFDFLSIGNNHINDFGRAGIKSTIQTIRMNEMLCAGVSWLPSVVKKINGKTVGFAAFSFNANTIHINDTVKVKEIISQLSKSCDFVLVSFHGGGEGKLAPVTINSVEHYKNENRGNSVMFAHLAIRCGADVVFGHGPHITRAVEIYQNRFIAYSLGNFCTPAGFSLKGSAGVAPMIRVEVNNAGEFIRGKIISVKQKRFSGPRIDSDSRALREIIERTKRDFPGSQLQILSDGEILPALTENGGK